LGFWLDGVRFFDWFWGWIVENGGFLFYSPIDVGRQMIFQRIR